MIIKSRNAQKSKSQSVCPFICIRCRRCWRSSKIEYRSANASLEALHAFKDLQARSELFDLTARLSVQNSSSRTSSIFTLLNIFSASRLSCTGSFPIRLPLITGFNIQRILPITSLRSTRSSASTVPNKTFSEIQTNKTQPFCRFLFLLK